MKTMSIDASSTSSGIAIFEQSKLIYYECITASSNDFIKRIDKMIKRIRQLYNQYQPSDIVMEQVLPQDVKHNQNVYKVLIYLQAGVVMELHKSGIKVKFMVASHWRKICGIKTGASVKREALKKASQNLVKNIYQIDVNDDISDAICLGMAYIIENKQQNAF